MFNKTPLLLLLLPLLLPGSEAACKTSALSEFELAVLDKHNELRALHKETPDLCYGESSSDVTFTSQSWAEAMANVKTMKHSTGSYGENLAYAGTTGTVPGEKAAYITSTQLWYDEIKDWDFSKSASKGGVTGHFTQVVWAASKQVNCGYATFKDNSFNSYYVVCQYYPPGNYNNQYATQVFELKKGGSGSGSWFSWAVTALVAMVTALRLL
ncbi:hypothetical protein ACHWQZ_G000380 [Mnemiopsis leidyi]